MTLLDLCGQCTAAIDKEIEAAKRGGGSTRSIKLVHGRYIRSASDASIYVFSATKSVPTSYDDAPAVLHISNHEVAGTVIAVGEVEVTLALDDYVGPYVAEAQLVIDLTFILERLKEALAGKAADLDRNAITRTAFGLQASTLNEAEPNECYNLRDEKQERALRRCLGSDFVLLWGPPGTGKTHVLARLMREQVLGGRTTLLVSNTNIAVDQALAKFLGLIEGDSKLQKMIREGRFVRLGTPHLSDADSLTLKAVLDKLNKHILSALEDKRVRLELVMELAAQAEEAVAAMRRVEEGRRRLDDLDQAILKASERMRVATDRYNLAKANLLKARSDLKKLESQRGIRRALSVLARASLQGQIESLTQNMADLTITLQRLTHECGEYQAEIESLEGSIEDGEQLLAELGIGEVPLEDMEAAAEAHSLERDTLVDEIRELENRLLSIEERVVGEAMLVACTCAKSTLDRTLKTRQFDTVIVDEASMVSLPQALWCASMARSKFIYCGDFRQLPPICQVREEDHPTEYNTMHHSLFEHLHLDREESPEDDPRCVMLTGQRRMADQICQLVSQPMYGGKLTTVTTGEAKAPIVACPITLISSSQFNAWSDKTTESYSWFNWHHAFAIVELVRQIRNGDVPEVNKDTEIAILAPFVAQIQLVNALLAEAGLEDKLKAKVATVWRSQGTESDVVIFDTVCGPPFARVARWFNQAP